VKTTQILKEKLHNLFSLPNNIRVINQGGVKSEWMGYLAYMGEMRDACNILWGASKGETSCKT
jgi:hypothetical protein